MSKKNIQICVILTFLVLSGCNPLFDLKSTYSILNKTNKDIGMVVKQRPFGERVLISSSFDFVSSGAVVRSNIWELPYFVIGNLDDTTMLAVSHNTLSNIYYSDIITDHRDSVIKQSLRWPRIDDDYYWTITDELLSIMEKDYQ